MDTNIRILDGLVALTLEIVADVNRCSKVGFDGRVSGVVDRTVRARLLRV